MKKTVALIGCLAVLFLPEVVQGQEERAIQLSLVNPIQLVPEDDAVRGLRLSLLYGRNTDVSGLDIGLVAHATGDFQGLQWTGVGLTEGSFTGWQTGLVNIVQGDFEGLQTGVVNSAETGRGLQWGAVNHSNNFRGLQLSDRQLRPSAERRTDRADQHHQRGRDVSGLPDRQLVTGPGELTRAYSVISRPQSV